VAVSSRMSSANIEMEIKPHLNQVSLDSTINRPTLY